MTTRAKTPPSRTQIADLRASLHSTGKKPKFDKEPPAPKKHKKSTVDHAEARAEKAERQSMQQHTTSLLTGKAGNQYVRKGERPQSSGTILGMMFQIIFVVGLVGGVAYALDPTLLPPEWNAKAVELIDQIKSHDMVKQWLPV